MSRGGGGRGRGDGHGQGQGPRGGGPPQPPFRPPAARSSAPPRWDVLDLAAANAPNRVLQLIGDPRSGVADDTTTTPFGEVTVDMIHHQPSNEVYWYKYEFSGGATARRGAHRDARLSDYSRSLMYLLRAKDPQRWTLQALADKFRIRKQRVLAILALKELESQRIESGRLLTGPLSAYALTVAPADLHIRAPAAAAASAAKGPQRQQRPPATVEPAHLLPSMLPRVLSSAQRTQAQLLELLRAGAFDAASLRTSLLADMSRVEEMAAAMSEAGGAGGNVAAFLQAELDACRAAVEGVVGAVEGVVAGSPLLQEERQAAALQAAVEVLLEGASQEVVQEVRAMPLTYVAPPPPGSREGAAAGESVAGEGAGAGAGEGAGVSAASEGLQALQQQLLAVLEPVMEQPGSAHSGGGDLALQRFFFSLAPPTRAALLRLLLPLAVRLNAAGVDLVRAGRDADYHGPAAAAAGAASEAAGARAAAAASKGAGKEQAASSSPVRGLPRLAVDVWGFLPVPERQQEALAAAVDAVAAAEAALVAKVEALGVAAAPADAHAGARSAASLQRKGEQAAAAAAAPSVPSSGSDLRAVRALVRRYMGAAALWDDLLAGGVAQGTRDAASKRRKLELMAEADPSAVTRALQVEAAIQLRRSRDHASADRLKAGVAAAAAAEKAAAAATAGAGSESESVAVATPQAPPSLRPGDLANWDALAAYLDARVAGRVYSRGSGERHVARLPSYPAFEGYSLEEFDSAREGELSVLNRAVAERTDAAMFDQFRRDLLFNLGVRGEKLRDSDPGSPAWPSNLRTELLRPVVVYDIGPDGSTQYPPLHVATLDGTKRPLNEQERVFQERRLPAPRLPYYVGRIRRLPELP